MRFAGVWLISLWTTQTTETLITGRFSLLLCLRQHNVRLEVRMEILGLHTHRFLLWRWRLFKQKSPGWDSEFVGVFANMSHRKIYFLLLVWVGVSWCGLLWLLWGDVLVRLLCFANTRFDDSDIINTRINKLLFVLLASFVNIKMIVTFTKLRNPRFLIFKTFVFASEVPDVVPVTLQRFRSPSFPIHNKYRPPAALSPYQLSADAQWKPLDFRE